MCCAKEFPRLDVFIVIVDREMRLVLYDGRVDTYWHDLGVDEWPEDEHNVYLDTHGLRTLESEMRDYVIGDPDSPPMSRDLRSRLEDLMYYVRNHFRT